MTDRADTHYVLDARFGETGVKVMIDLLPVYYATVPERHSMSGRIREAITMSREGIYKRRPVINLENKTDLKLLSKGEHVRLSVVGHGTSPLCSEGRKPDGERRACQ